MTHRVTLHPSGHAFDNPPGETLLESALASGLAVDYGCSNGNCGKCRARRVRGELRRLKHSDFSFAAAESAAGWFLLCCHGAASDLVVDSGIARDAGDIEHQEIDVKVKKVSPLDARTVDVHVQTPRTRRLRFLAGQSARLARDGACVALPIASCPCDDRNIHFHLRSGDDAAALFEAGVTLRLSGPLGDFVLDAGSMRPRLMVGTGPGLAPLKSIIEHSQSLDGTIPVRLLLVEESRGTHYMNNLLRSWRDALDSFDYVSAPPGEVEDALRGLPGRIGSAAHECDWYVCGPGEFVDDTLRLLARWSAPVRSMAV